MTVRLRVLGVFPHPDDESYSCGGTLARLAAEGADVHLLCTTAGGSGKDLRAVGEPAALSALRSDELVCACAALGIAPPEFLGLEDGGLDLVDFAGVAGRIITTIRSHRPHIVLSLGPDGVYGHPDHIALHRLLVAAFAAAQGGDRFPPDRFGGPWAPQRLYLAAFPRGMFRPMYDHMLSSEYAGSIRALDPEKLGVEPAEVAAAIDIRPFATQKLAAIACHTSQLRDGDPFSLFPGDLVRRTLTMELYTIGAGEPATGRLRSLAEGIAL